MQTNTLTDFEADSEGSDTEALPRAVSFTLPLTKSTHIFTFNGSDFVKPSYVLPGFSKSPPKPNPMRAEFVSPAHPRMDTEAVSLADCNGNASSFQSTITAQISVTGNVAPVSPVASSTVASNTTPPSATKRFRQPDASKFNRSNRKSKNCATFYFKHSDTDGDAKGWSTQASEVGFVCMFLNRIGKSKHLDFKFQSVNATSEEDEWFYSNKPNNRSDDSPNEMTDENVEMINTAVPIMRQNGDRSNRSIDEVDAVPRKPEVQMMVCPTNIENRKLSLLTKHTIAKYI